LCNLNHTSVDINWDLVGFTYCGRSENWCVELATLPYVFDVSRCLWWSAQSPLP